MLEGLGPDGAANVVDQNVDTSETHLGGSHDAGAFGVLLKVGGKDQRPLMLQFMHEFRAVDRHQPGALFQQALGDTPADALGGTGHQRNLGVETWSHGGFLRRRRR